ncbi:MAG: hypothetical protein M3R63_18470, partial [Actinomycetota bacterium]|nr:hypothetical protein [Actinomycetota bacterium]
ACHADYLRPLDVVWLCIADKRRRRAELGPPRNAAAAVPPPSPRGGSLPLKVRMERKRSGQTGGADPGDLHRSKR